MLSPTPTPTGILTRTFLFSPFPSTVDSGSHSYRISSLRAPLRVSFSEIIPPTMDDHQSATPTAQHSAWIARRRRKPLSCTLCRQRKLSCDRERPACSRCRNAGRGDSCTYGERLPSTTSSKEGSGSGIGEPSRVEPPSPIRDYRPSSPPRLSAITDKNRSPLPASNPTRNNIPWGLSLSDSYAYGIVGGSARPAIKADLTKFSHPEEPKSTEAVIFRGKNYTTQYYGSTNPTSLIGHVSINRTSSRC